MEQNQRARLKIDFFPPEVTCIFVRHLDILNNSLGRVHLYAPSYGLILVLDE